MPLMAHLPGSLATARQQEPSHLIPLYVVRFDLPRQCTLAILARNIEMKRTKKNLEGRKVLALWFAASGRPRRAFLFIRQTTLAHR